MWKWWPWHKKEEQTKIVHFPDVRVVISRENLEKLKSYVLSVDTEIMGLGMVSQRDNVFYISEIFLLNQIANGGGAKLEPVAMSKLINRLAAEGKDRTKLKFVWHSHVNMGAFWSGTDMQLSENLENEKFSISLVINKRLEYLCRLDLYSPLRITVDKIPLEIHGEYAVAEDPSEEVNKKVRGYGNNGNTYQGCLICGGKDPNCWWCQQINKETINAED